MSKENDKLKMVLGMIDLRRKSAQRKFEDALKNGEWSKLAEFDGIDCGLLIAEKIVKEIFRIP